MTAYYNEFDAKAAAWLLELIGRGLIAPGDVDTRSIKDVKADDIKGYSQVHLFAGIGGWSRALRLAGWPDDRPVWTGSCPCQPFSAAGKQRGEQDDRHLWPEMLRLLTERRPSVCLGEQVASRLGREWLAGVRADLETLGYAVGAADLCAAGVGAPHIRQRLWWGAVPVSNAAGRGLGVVGRTDLAGNGGHADGGCEDDASVLLGDGIGSGLEGHARHGDDGHQPGRINKEQARSTASPGGIGAWGNYVVVPCGDGKARRLEPGIEPVAHGVPARVVRLRGYGNAIVPQVAAAFIKSFEGAIA